MTGFFKQNTLTDQPVSLQKAALPKQIGPYPIESLLAEGGMSFLYLAIHPQTHEPIVVKVLRPEFVQHPELSMRFLKEASIIALTNHPNIVKLFGQGKWEGGLYIAMEFIQGISLRRLILQNALSLKRAIEIVLQISYALFHLHAHGVIHRDLKPENILLTEAGGIKVIDFGIAQLKEESATEHVIGTPFYMSPERRKDPGIATYASDIYSLGIIAYELVLGKLSHGIVHLSLLPIKLQKILQKALQPDPNLRYLDIIDFTADLTNYLESESFEKDTLATNQSAEFLEQIKAAEGLLTPKSAPHLDKIEIGLASSTKMQIQPIYYDFLVLEDSSIAIILAESAAPDASSLLYASLIKGVVLSQTRLLTEPAKFATELNRILVAQKIEQPIVFSLLVLHAPRHLLRFVSCGLGSLWHLPTGLATPKQLTTNNLALGITTDTPIIDINGNWNIGDRLLLHTFRARQEGELQTLLADTIYLSAQKQADAILRKINATGENGMQNPMTLISIARKS